MKLQQSSRVVAFFVFILTITGGIALCEERTDAAPASNFRSATIAPNPGLAAVSTSTFTEPGFLGAYLQDGIFKPSPKHGGFTAINLPPKAQLRPVEVPPWFDLHPIESVVDDFVPPVHARRPMRAKSRFASFRDRFVTLAYGREKVLLAPTHVTTDSHQRLLISDPNEPAIHVLDGLDSFRIVGGPQRRLQHPHGIAVDAEDNIYVADGKLGTILVYDSRGTFLRSIGDFKGEGMFQQPTGIAIDRDARLLYILDSPLNQLIVLDLSGRTVKRIGSFRDRTSRIRFVSPTAISVGRYAIVVLDMYGSRVQVLDLEGNYVTQFMVRNLRGPISGEMGIAQDTQGNIYVSNLESSSVRIFHPDGRPVGNLKQPGTATAKFSGASQLWIDDSDRIYIADINNSRVLVFQAATPAMAAKAKP